MYKRIIVYQNGDLTQVNHLDGDCMSPVFPYEISNCPAETDFTIQLYGQINSPHGKTGRFYSRYLFRFIYIFFILPLYSCLKLLSHPTQMSWTITWETFVPAKRNPGSIGGGCHLAWWCNHVIITLMPITLLIIMI